MSDAPGAALSLPPWRVERILYDQDGWLVVDKPVGIPVYGGDEELDHGVVSRLGEWARSRERELRLGVHQRLDQETSGLLFFTTSRDCDPQAARAMERREISRVYHAVVELSPGARLREGRIELWLQKRRQAMVVVPGPGKDAQQAVTTIQVLRRVGRRALVECSLETGRTHQIRATLAHLGAHIVGDRLYGGAPAPRLLLHASCLSGQPIPKRFESPLPSVFEAFLQDRPWNPPQEDLQDLLLDALSLRAPLLKMASAFRLVNGEGDLLYGLTVDLYERHAVINVYDPSWLARIELLGELLRSAGVHGVYLKQRVRADLRKQDAKELAQDAPIAGTAAESGLVVKESDARFCVELADGLSSGLFVDMRDNRRRLAQWLSNRPGASMLNLFCYTCSFSVVAALAGAATTSVDLSKKALLRGRKNFEINGLSPDEHRFFKEDALKFLARSVRRGDEYDFIVLDPPSFSTVSKGTFSVSQKYQSAVADCLRLLSPGGRLLCVTNHTKTTPAVLRRWIHAAASEASRTITSLVNLRPGLDCPPDSHGPWPSQSAIVEVA